MSITRIAPGTRMSQAAVYNGFVFTAGQVDDQSPTVAGQTERVLEKIDTLLTQAGTNRSQIISANIWLSDIASFDEMNAVWEAWIDRQNPPTRATVESRLAGPEYKVEIAVTAAVEPA
ncbi:MAG: RidA family protein [Candidatus Eremiobacteraeota bacterium]|nr:RidA family protein [Candidatus Eremiobacteraeota bacterium]